MIYAGLLTIIAPLKFAPMRKATRIFFILIIAIAFKSKAQVNFKDSLDGKLDLSDWVQNVHGFIPIPSLITEPAFGNIGGALFPVFIKSNTPYIDTINGKIITERVKPNIYGVGGAYTANKTWLVGGAWFGVIKKWRAQYRIAAGYADLNIEYYKTISDSVEQSFEFNFITIPVCLQLIKQLKKRSHWYAGVNYLFLKTNFKKTDPEFYSPGEIDKIISRAGLILEYDNRDNIFTPDDGFRWNTILSASDEIIGSSYNYQHLNSAAFYYLPLSNKFIAGFRTEYQQAWGDVPFYIKPFINMRGIPIARYQGMITALGETELRWDFARRFSLVTFGGAGKAIESWKEFDKSNWHGAGGVGGRYLIARKLKLRMGLDIARGPEQWAYYIVFGTNWIR